MKYFIELVALTLALGMTSCCCKSKEEKERDVVAAASASAKRAAVKAELAAQKKKCGDRYDTYEWESTCRDLVRARLFQPSSADFSIIMSGVSTKDPVKCSQFYSSTVESKNAFGATVEHRFSCSFDTKKNWVTLDFIGMN